VSWLPSRTVAALATAQAVKNSGAAVVVVTAPLVGAALASDEALATIPLAALPLAAVTCTIPAAWLMLRIGRKLSFMLSTGLGIGGCLLAWMSISSGRFWLFVLSVALIGAFNAVGNYFRFAAADSVPKPERGRAVGYVLVGGVVAALVGPNLANAARSSIDGAPFAGSYAAMIPLYVLAFVALSLTSLPKDSETKSTEATNGGRPLRAIVSQPRYIVAVTCATLGYAGMSLVMTATPLAMQHNAHAFSDTAFVIQWHVLGMFAPSFVTGELIRRFGVLPIMSFGALLGFGCVLTNLVGTSVWHFWLALLLLGLSWNFLFVGGTTLLTETYRPSERAQAQATNDFVVFSVVAVASLSAGALHHAFGWEAVNIAALPMYAIALLSIGWCARQPES
jgi:MFS family permease